MCGVCVCGVGGYITQYVVTTGVRIRVMVFNTTFNNLSVISWQSCPFYSLFAVKKKNIYLRFLNSELFVLFMTFPNLPVYKIFIKMY
jgi:hypothetical protein